MTRKSWLLVLIGFLLLFVAAGCVQKEMEPSTPDLTRVASVVEATLIARAVEATSVAAIPQVTATEQPLIDPPTVTPTPLAAAGGESFDEAPVDRALFVRSVYGGVD